MINELKGLIISSVLKDKSLVDIELYKVNKTKTELQDFELDEVPDLEDTIREVFAREPKCVYPDQIPWHITLISFC